MHLRSENRIIWGNEALGCLDECLSTPHTFKLLLLGTIPDGQEMMMKDPDIPFLLSLLIICENKLLRIPNRGCLHLTSSVIAYALKTHPKIFESNSWTHSIFYFIKSKAILNELLEAVPELVSKTSESGQSLLHFYVSEIIELTSEERRDLVTVLIKHGADIHWKDQAGNSVLHYCCHLPTAYLFIAQNPALLFDLNHCFQLPSEVNGHLKDDLCELQQEHIDSSPFDADLLVQAAVGRAIIFSSPNDMDRAKELISNGANLHSNLMLHGVGKPIFWYIMDQAILEEVSGPWNTLLTHAIKYAPSDQRLIAFNYAMGNSTVGDEKQWFAVAQQIASTFSPQAAASASTNI